MTPHAVLAVLQDHPRRPFWSAFDVAHACGAPIPEARAALATLVQQDALATIAGDLYTNPFSTYTAEALAGALLGPSYLSLEYALHCHNVLPQGSWTLTSVTTAPRRVMVVEGWRFEYESVPEPVFGGFAWASDPATDAPVALATPTKALLDWLYCRGVAGGWSNARIASMLDDMNLDEIAPDTLMADAARYFPDPHRRQQLLTLAQPALRNGGPDASGRRRLPAGAAATPPGNSSFTSSPP